MRFLVHPPNRQTVRLERPGPGGKGKISVTFPAKDRWVSIPDVSCSVFAQCVADLIKSGTLIVPRRDGQGETPPAAADLKFKVLAPSPGPVVVLDDPPVDEVSVEVTEAEIVDVDLETKPKRNRRSW